MKAIDFKERNVIIAKDQEDYRQLPAFWNTAEGSATFCFELNKEDLEQIQKTGKIWVKQLTFGNPMQPMNISTEKTDLI